MLEITVHEIKGLNPVCKKEDKITIDSPQIILDKTDALCTHALSSILHYSTVLEYDWCPVKRGLTTIEDKDCAYLQFTDTKEPYIKEGTVICKYKKLRDD